MDLFVALVKPGNHRLLELCVDSKVVAEIEELPTAKGISCAVRPADESGRVYLELALVDAAARDIFTALAGDVARTVSTATNDSAAVTAWVAQLRRWQRLLARGGADGLSGQLQRGLYAELWLLRVHLFGVLDPTAAISAWTGPEHASHDFQVSNCAVEVKATASKQHQVLRISSERQLDSAGIDHLLLFHLSLDVRRGDENTLIDAVAQVRNELKGHPALALFEAHTSYSVREENFFDVVGDFPRIIESDLRVGVGDVAYSVAVAECKHYRIDREAAVKMLFESGANA